MVDFTEHAIQRLAERGITREQVNDAMEAAKRVGTVRSKTGKYGTPQSISTANHLRVIIEEAGTNQGKVITVFMWEQP